MTKKIILLFIFASILFSTLIACGKKEEEKVKIEYWTLQTQTERKEKIQVLLDAFQILNPDIEVVLVPTDEPELTALIAAAASSGTLPDLIDSTQQFALSFNSEGIVRNDTVKEALDEIGVDKFAPSALKIVSYDNQYYGVPLHFQIQGLWYRKDWFQEAGLPVPDTLENILKAAKYFYQPDENQYGVLVGTTAEPYTEQVYTEIAIANNAYNVNTDGSIQFGDQATIESMNYYKELAQYNPPGPQTWRARDYYLQGKMAMFFYSTFIMDDLAVQDVAASSLTNENFSDLAGAEFDANLVQNTGVVTKIRGIQESSYGEITALVPLKVSEPSDRKDMAVKKLLTFLLDESNYIPYIHVAPGGMLPVLTSVVNNDDFYDDEKQVYSRYSKDQILSLIKGLDSMKSFIVRDGVVLPQAGDIAAKMIIPQAVYSITIDGEDVQSAVDTAVAEMQQVVNR